MLKLRFTADDFGLTPGYSARILEHARAGRLSAVSAVVTGKPDPRLFQALAACPVKLGLHLNLTTGRPCAPTFFLAGLLNSQGRFHSPASFFCHSVLMQIPRKSLFFEAQAQLRRFRSLLPRLDYLDSHFHLHLLPCIFNTLEPLIKAEMIPALRNPFCSLPLFPDSIGLSRDTVKLLLITMGRLQRLHRRGPMTADRVLGVHQLTPDRLFPLLNPIRDHQLTVEIILHPEEEHAGPWNQWLNADGARELAQKLDAELECGR